MIQVQLKLRLTKTQERTLDRWIWHLTGVWNWAIRKIEADARSGIYHSRYDLKALLTGHGKRLGIPSAAMNGTVTTAYQSWRRCFKKIAKRPRLKGARHQLSSIAFDHWWATQKNGRIRVPVLGFVRFHRQDLPSGHVGSARIVRRASGWYLCLFVQVEPRPIVSGSAEVGIDPGFSSLLTFSTGEKVEHPHEWRLAEKRVGQAQRGGRRQLAARLQERIASRRKNRNHHLSRRLVESNGFIAFSKDYSRGLARSFGKSVTSAGHHQLRQMLAYKSRAGGAHYVEVPSRNSTKTCSACGALTGPTGWAGLKVRQWVCTDCGVEHDRDCNAAVNTLIAGLGTSHESYREVASGIAS